MLELSLQNDMNTTESLYNICKSTTQTIVYVSNNTF